MTTVVIRGIGEIGSAVAHALFRAGYAAVIHQPDMPLTTRRHMAFADAMFDGTARLDGVCARKVADPAALAAVIAGGGEIPIVTTALASLLDSVRPQVLVDAQLRKRSTPESQRGLAPLVIGLGPNFVAGGNVDIVVETSWDDLGKIIRRGPSLPLTGEPRMLAGHGRERFVYAPRAGTFRTTYDIGAPVRAGETIATIGASALCAPLAGILRGIVRDNVAVPAGTKVIEVDPTGNPATACGVGERPYTIAAAVLHIVNEHRSAMPPRDRTSQALR